MGGNADERILAELGEALRSARSVPGRHRRAARAAWSWRTVDTELALLMASFDSADEEAGAAVLVRGAPMAPTRVLAFGDGATSVHLEVADDTLTGVLVPPRSGPLLVEAADGTRRTVDVDEQGFFRLAEPTRGPTRFRRPGDLVTEWVNL